MAWIEDTLVEFGRQMGLGPLAFGRHGLLQLRFPSGGFLAVEPSPPGHGEAVLVYRGLPVGHQAAALVQTALARVHAIDGGAPLVQVGLRGSGPEAELIVVARVPERAFTPQALSSTARYLERWLDDVQAGRAN